MSGTVTLKVPSHPKYLYIIRSTLYPIVIDAGFSRREARKIILAVDEACSNIIKHAYGGAQAEEIIMGVSITEEKLIIMLEDFGKQVDRSDIAPRDLGDVRPGGLGTHFMGSVFDRVEYDTSRERGTLLILEKGRR